MKSLVGFWVCLKLHTLSNLLPVDLERSVWSSGLRRGLMFKL